MIRSQEVEVEEEKFCWVWCAKLTNLVLVVGSLEEDISACRSIGGVNCKTSYFAL